MIKIVQPAEAQRDEWLNPQFVQDIYQTVDAKEQPVILYLVYLKYQECLKKMCKRGISREGVSSPLPSPGRLISP